eukprot:766388-Hanusia_phi.AAC.4
MRGARHQDSPPLSSQTPLLLLLLLLLPPPCCNFHPTAPGILLQGAVEQVQAPAAQAASSILAGFRVKGRDEVDEAGRSAHPPTLFGLSQKHEASSVQEKFELVRKRVFNPRESMWLSSRPKDSSWNMVENDALFRAVRAYGTDWQAILNSSGYGCLLKGRDSAALAAQWSHLKSIGNARKVEQPQQHTPADRLLSKKWKKKMKKLRAPKDLKTEPFSSAERFKVLRGMELVGWGRWKDILCLYTMRRSADMLKSFAVSLILPPRNLDLRRVASPPCEGMRTWRGSAHINSPTLCFPCCATADPSCLLAVDNNLLGGSSAHKEGGWKPGIFVWVLSDKLPPWPAVTVRTSRKSEGLRKEKKKNHQVICFGTFEQFSTSVTSVKSFESAVNEFFNATEGTDRLQLRCSSFLTFSNASRLLADDPKALELYKKSIIDAADAWLDRENLLTSSESDTIHKFCSMLKAEEHLLRNSSKPSKKEERFR